MFVWKEAYQLAQVELKKSKLNMFLSWFILTGISLVILLLYNYFTSPDPYHDFVFFSILIGIPYFFRKREFKYNNIKDELWASPTIIHYLQLPIPRGVIVRSRLIIYWFYFIPFFVTVFILLYSYDKFVSELSFMQFIAFLLVWLAFSMSFGLVTIAYDIGGRIIYKRWFLVDVLPIFIVIFAYYIFYKIYNMGLVLYTMKLAQNWTFLCLLISIFVIFFSLIWRLNMMERKININDYNC